MNVDADNEALPSDVDETLDAEGCFLLPGIIDDLKKQGYSFVTIDELCEMGGVPNAAQGED